MPTASNGRGHELARFDINPKGNYFWALSPDGNRIALMNTAEGPIRILSLRGMAPLHVSVKGWNTLDSVAWAADGTGLFVSSRVQQGSVLLHVDLRGNAQILWKEEGSLGTYAILSPDGRHLAIRSWTLESNIWTMENF
jgi:WD40 repeat protein